MIKPIRNPYSQLLQYTSAAGIKYLGGWYYTIYLSPVKRLLSGFELSCFKSYVID